MFSYFLTAIVWSSQYDRKTNNCKDMSAKLIILFKTMGFKTYSIRGATLDYSKSYSSYQLVENPDGTYQKKILKTYHPEKSGHMWVGIDVFGLILQIDSVSLLPISPMWLGYNNNVKIKEV